MSLRKRHPPSTRLSRRLELNPLRCVLARSHTCMLCRCYAPFLQIFSVCDVAEIDITLMPTAASGATRAIIMRTMVLHGCLDCPPALHVACVFAQKAATKLNDAATRASERAEIQRAEQKEQVCCASLWPFLPVCVVCLCRLRRALTYAAALGGSLYRACTTGAYMQPLFAPAFVPGLFLRQVPPNGRRGR